MNMLAINFCNIFISLQVFLSATQFGTILRARIECELYGKFLIFIACIQFNNKAFNLLPADNVRFVKRYLGGS